MNEHQRNYQLGQEKMALALFLQRQHDYVLRHGRPNPRIARDIENARRSIALLTDVVLG